MTNESDVFPTIPMKMAAKKKIEVKSIRCTQIVSTLDFRDTGLKDLQEDMQSAVLLSHL